VHKIIGCVFVAAVAAGCHEAAAPPSPTSGEPGIQVRESPTPFTEITAGSIRAMVPDEWRPVPLGGAGDLQEGFVAAPRPDDWGRPGIPTEGMAAVWVDITRVGVPSDFYYLAATGPALDALTGSPECEATRVSVFVDHRPSFADGEPGSPGDYVARGQGVCTVHRHPTRWAYFVAAPGYGPVREVGIPASGLYMVVAVLRDSPRAPILLNKLVRHTEFGGTSVPDLIAVAQAA
jgi:hypothetical protein